MKMKKYLPILYTAVISIVIFGLLLAFRGFYPFGNGSVMLTDMYDECVPSLYRFYDIIYGNKNIFYEFQASGGLNLYTETINEIVNPFNYLLLLWNRENIYLAVNILLMLYVVFAACSVHLCLIKIWDKPSKLNCILSLCYAFSGYFAYNFQILRWMIIPVIFPVFLLSCMKLWEEQKGVLYSVLLAYQIVLSVQHGYMTILFVLFTSGIWMYCMNNKKDRKQFCVNLALYTVAGVFLSAVVLLPTASTLLNSARSGANASYFKVFVEHGLRDLFERLFQFCHPVLVGALLVYLYDFIKQNKFADLLKTEKIRFFLIWNVFLWLTVLVQPVNLLWHMGSYVCFPVRYGYMLVMAMVCLIKALEEKCITKEEGKDAIKTAGIIKCVLVLGLITGAVVLLKINEMDIVGGFLSLAISATYTKEASIVLIILLMLFASAIVACKKENKTSILLWLTVVVSSYCYFNMISLPKDYREKQEENYKLMNEEYREIESQSFDSLIQREKHNPSYPRNAALINGISSMSGYFPTAEAAFQEIMDKLGYMTPWVSTIDVGGTKISDYYFDHAFILSEENADFKFSSDMPLENQKILLEALFFDEISREELDSVFSIVTGNFDFDIQDTTTIYLDAGAMYQNLEVVVNNTPVKLPMEYMQDSPHVVLCLGTFDAGNIHIELYDSEGEVYPVENVKIGLLDETKWLDVIVNTNHEFNSQNIAVKSQGFKCELELYEDVQEGVLVLPINETKGWKCIVDNTEVEVKSIGDCFVGIDVTEETQNIILKFQPPFWSLGCALSLVGAVLLLVVYICKERNVILHMKEIEIITQRLYLFVFWGAILMVYVIPTIGITVHMLGRVIKLLL